MSVEVNSVSKVYGVQNAVDNVSFSAKKGQILGFLGPNGAGKTTTMKMITGYIPPSAGSIRVCDLDVSEKPKEAAALIGYLPEHNPLYKDMYVQEYLEFVAGIHGLTNKRSKADEMIAKTGLTLERHKKIQQLSKGYRQRVGLAQAMIHDPQVLILDEPTSGLDPNQLKEIRSLIKELGKEKTLIFSTHIMQEVQALCDRVIIINLGKIVADDPIDRLQSRISGETVVLVRFDRDANPVSLKQVTGVQGLKRLAEGHYELSSNSSIDIRPALFQYAVEAGLSILELKQETLSIEQIFQQLTSKGNN
jgi:ABC-2 type transport system ATP-binding protein